MKHTPISPAWRPMRARRGGARRSQGILSGMAFNLCLFLLPIAAATALVVIARDQLYAYEYSESGARAIATRVARLNGQLIQLDFDRQNQWDDLVALEIQANDADAARGFLLSGGGMLPRRSANVLNGAHDATDRELEVAAMQFLNPGTRQRYQDLIARDRQAPQSDAAIGDVQDFDLLARATLDAPENDALQFLLTGYAIGLGGDLSPRMQRGAAALLDASRREDYPQDFGAEVINMLSASMPLDAYRERASVEDADLRAAFQASIVAAEAGRVRTLLDEIGAMSEATSRRGAAALITHGRSLRDLPRLRLLAQAAGDRAAAAAKRLPRDGRLLQAASGELTMNQDLMSALIVAALALAGLVLVVLGKLTQGALQAWHSWRDENDDSYASELVELGGGPTSSWRPL
ncbi:MAG: hypothetical protein JNM59_10055 [Hyphomonadaceae bacterium]|nr:hypothetical protein [Hyphomonadaceae bacterium]